MLYYLSSWLSGFWGPLRLFGSHTFLIAVGALAGGAAVWCLLPRLWNKLPTDQGKALVPGGEQSKGKPTGAGLWLTLLLLPMIVLLMPLDWWSAGVVGCLAVSMWFGYLDDASKVPWGQLKKGVLDLAIAALTALLLCKCQPVEIWLPLYSGALTVPVWLFMLYATFLLFFSTNTTNCSDGVDGLAGSLTLISIFALAAFLYGVVGHVKIAEYLLVPHNVDGARWAILLAIVGGGLGGYLWYNANPSAVLMGDAGSRMLGLLVGVAVLASGNPFMILVVSPVVLVNGGGGLLKLVSLRTLKKLGFDIRPPTQIEKHESAEQHVLVKALHSIRWPLHDHCRKNLGWSPTQVLVRFMLLQSFLVPVLFVLLVKIR